MRWRLAAPGDPRPRSRIRRSCSGCRSRGRRKCTILAPEHIETIRDETRLLEDQQDVTPMGLAYQAIELGTSQNPLDASLRRVIKAMRL